MKKLDLVEIIHEIGFNTKDLLSTLESEVYKRFNVDETVALMIDYADLYEQFK